MKPQLNVLAILLFFFPILGRTQQVEIVYRNYCGGCHGARMEGGTGPKLVKAKWNHELGYRSIFKTIKFGVPKTEMKGWRTVLSEKEISALTTYIIASQKGPARKSPALPKEIRTKD